MPQTISLIWLVAGAALIGVVTRVAIPPATWLAVVFLLHASRSMPAATGLPCVWLALYAALLVGNPGMMPMPRPAYFVTVALMAASAALPVVLDRFAAPRLGVVGSTLIFPMAWVAAEFLPSRFTPQATWGSIAYTQYGYLPLMQVAAFVGIWGITFLIAWFASTFDWAWSRGFEWNVVRVPVLA